MSKVSKYNVYIKVKDSVIVYNTLWGSFLITNQQNSQLLQNGCSNCSDYNNEKLFKAFIDKKIIIEDTLDEYKFIQDTLDKTNNNPSYFELIVNPTLACNFRCWYCYESHKDTSKIDENGLNGILSLIQQKVIQEKIETFNIKFFGGEPLLCYDKVINPILHKIDELMKDNPTIFLIGITTNGYLLSKERLKNLHKYHVQNLQITIDGNKERHNQVRFSRTEKDSYSRIIGNICNALSVGIAVCLRLNISEDTCLNVQELLNDFDNLDETSKELLTFSVHKVWQANDAVHETIEKIVSDIRSKGYKCGSYFSAPSSIWSTCYADKPNHLTINPNGEIYKCTACDFSKGHIEGFLSPDGLIKWNDLHTKRLQASPLNIRDCRECSILPICVGGCSQHILENENPTECPFGLTSEEKEKYAYRILSEKLERNEI